MRKKIILGLLTLAMAIGVGIVGQGQALATVYAGPQGQACSVIYCFKIQSFVNTGYDTSGQRIIQGVTKVYCFQPGVPGFKSCTSITNSYGITLWQKMPNGTDELYAFGPPGSCNDCGARTVVMGTYFKPLEVLNGRFFAQSGLQPYRLRVCPDNVYGSTCWLGVYSSGLQTGVY